ncbi:MAG: hypothetical protein K2H96_07670 [Muribaculaceae bacterium]|nr:hypothetical protein [Muribaculaceae bacterium]
MKKIFTILTTCLIAGFVLVSCNSATGKSASSDSAVSDSTLIEQPTDDYSATSFSSPDEVREFLNFKKFDYAHGYIAFNGNGGVLDGEPFNVTDIALKNDRTAEISITVPKMNLSGVFTLKVADHGITLEDEKSHTTYKLR